MIWTCTEFLRNTATVYIEESACLLTSNSVKSYSLFQKIKAAQGSWVITTTPLYRSAVGAEAFEMFLLEDVHCFMTIILLQILWFYPFFLLGLGQYIVWFPTLFVQVGLYHVQGTPVESQEAPSLASPSFK